MSRKIQEFFKSTPKRKAVESTEDSGLVPSKKIKIQANQVTMKETIKTTADNGKTSKKEAKNLGQCKFCDLKILVASLLRHMKKIHPEQLKDLLKCQICQRKFIKKTALEQHMKIKHFDGKTQLFECDFCGKLTKAKEEMKHHIKIHLPTVECDICHAELKQLSIKSHMEEIHSKGQKIQCRMCPKMFKSKATWHNHEKIHDKKFQCTTCMKMFPTKSFLQNHQKEIHENPRSYSCEICGKKFNQKRSLRGHLKIHDRNRSKPFKCERCDFATDRLQSIKIHQIHHKRQDEKFAALKNPLKCPKCPALSRNKNALKKHLKNVHPDEPFQCDLCGIYIKAYGSVKKHISLHQLKKR